MDINRGIPVSPGVAIGPALVLDAEGMRIPQRHVDPNQVDSEVQRLARALKNAAAECRASQDSVSEQLGRHFGEIFGAHAVIIDDPDLFAEVEQLLRSQRLTAEYALSRVLRRKAKALESLRHSPNAERAADIADIEQRILGHLLGQRRDYLSNLSQPVVVLAHDLSPSETAALDPSKVHAFATEAGGRTSHTAIIAGALEIPAVVGLGKFVHEVCSGDLVIVDGNEGLLIREPDAATLSRYEATRFSQQRIESQRNELLRDLPAVTKDGTHILLLGNIEFPNEAAHCLDRGAAGVGLYRTEFLYLNRSAPPTEDEQVEAFRTVLNTLGPYCPMVIRTLDLGADKFPGNGKPETTERNPFLGLRSVRYCLRNLTLFKSQLRAILKASALGNVRIMFPMISTLRELRECKMLLAEAKEDLEEEGVAFDRDLSIGTMIEVPAAALMADQLAREVRFFSIGTNDLIQYLLAADRTNEYLAELYSPADPAVLRLIRMVVEIGQQNGIEVNVCGEMSGEPMFCLLLIGMGLRQMSMTPQNIPIIKKLIRSVEISDCQRLASEAMQMDNAKDIANYLREQMRRLWPESDGEQ